MVIADRAQMVVGDPVAFAAETDSVEENARAKLSRKGADLMVANDVSDKRIGFDSNENEVVVLDGTGVVMKIDRAPKPVVADCSTSSSRD